MAKRIQKVQAVVYEVLLTKPETRADDHILILEVYKSFISADLSFNTVLAYHRELGLPSFASILRSRRKLQRKYPELVNEEAARKRAEKQKEYEAYAINS